MNSTHIQLSVLCTVYTSKILLVYPQFPGCNCLLFSRDFTGMCMIYSHGIFHMPSCTASLVITTKLKARCWFCITAILCRLNTAGLLLTKATYFPTINCNINRSWNSSQYGNRLQGRGTRNHAAIPGKDARFLSSPKHPDWLWNQPSLLFIGYKGLSTGVKQTSQDTDHIFPSRRMSSAVFLFLHTDFMMSTHTHTISLYFAWLLRLYYS